MFRLNYKDGIRSLMMLFVALPMLLLASCKDDDDAPAPEPTQGVKFRFTYTEVAKAINKYVEEANAGGRIADTDVPFSKISSVNMILVDGSDERVTLPNLELTGDDEVKETKVVELGAGGYKLLNLIAYDAGGRQLFESEPVRNNTFSVEQSMVSIFDMPIEIKTVYDKNFVKNGLIALCTEVFGTDRTKWPKGWDLSKKIESWYDVIDWPYLSFAQDKGIIDHFTGFSFSGEEWAVLEKLPKALTYFQDIEFVEVVDVPNFKYMSDNLDEMFWLRGIILINTGFESFPEYMFDPEFNSSLKFPTGMEIYIRDCKNYKVIQEGLVNLKSITSLRLQNNAITVVDIPLHKLEQLDYINLSGNPLTSIGENVFGAQSNLSILELNNISGLTLPSNLSEMPNLKTVIMANCGLTRIPDQLKGCRHIELLHLMDNNITNIQAQDLSEMTSLIDLMLYRNPISGDASIVNSNLVCLGLNDCGLTKMPNLAGMPNLRALYLDDNKLTSVNGDFTANEYFRILSLNRNATLNALPEFTFKTTTGEEYPEYFRYLFLNGCSSLTWASPAYWNGLSFEAVKLPGEEYGSDPQHLVFPFPGLEEPNIYIDKRGAPNVTIGA